MRRPWALLGPLATAGMSALALEHESGRQLAVLDEIADRLEEEARNLPRVQKISADIRSWIGEFRNVRRVFEPLTNPDDREQVRPLKAGRVLELVLNSLSPFMGGTFVEMDVAPDLRLPAATLAEWQGLLQNVITNALNAMVSKRRQRVKLSAGRGPGRKAWIRISDNGSGIDLEVAERYFEPFQRHGDISNERRSMGLGGHGLGLTIVRMIAEGRRCKVAFVEPEPGYETTFELSWVGTNVK